MKAIAFFITYLFFLIFAVPAFAVPVSILDYPQTITDEPFNLTASISGATNGARYFLWYTYFSSLQKERK